MGAHGFRLTVVACLCGLACVFGSGMVSGVAGAAELGAFQIGSTETHGSFSEGEAAGRISVPTGVAVNDDLSSLLYGDLYVTDRGNNRIDRFAGSGAFQLAWGWGVNNGAAELQTCTTSCQRGAEQSPATGAIASYFPPGAIAVDSDPLSTSAGDVYLAEAGGELNRVEKFTASGEFLLMFGGGVNETTSGDICLAGEKCRPGARGASNGEFTFEAANQNVAVGPGGLVYVGDRTRVQVFEPSGAWKETISLSGLSSVGAVTALAVDASGDVFVKDSEAAGVHEFGPGGVEKGTVFDASSTFVTSIAVDGSGDLFVGDSSGGAYNGFHVLKYNIASGNEVGDFGSNTVRGGGTQEINAEPLQGPAELFHYNDMAFSEASGSGDLYVSEYYDVTDKTLKHRQYSSVWALPVPPPGPAIASESATPGPKGSVSLEAVVNPDGNETSYHFEYASEADFTKVVGGKACEWSCASSTPVGVLAAGLIDRSVSARATGLPISSVYRYRVLASNSESSKGPAAGPGQTFETLPAAYLETEYVTDVASTSATIDAGVNPLGSNTEYRVEYGTSTAYEHVATGSAGEGVFGELVSSHLQELSASTTYHYRVVLVNGLGTVEGPDRTFTTQRAGGELTLPDGREWELVSPPNKKGALIEPFELDQIQAASDGSGITYLTEGTHVGENPQAKITLSQVLSRRGAGGWRSEDVTLPTSISALSEGHGPLVLFAIHTEYKLFSNDLSSAAAEPQERGTPPLSPEATERTLYLRNDLNGSYTPLVSPGNVPPGTKFGGEGDPNLQMEFLAATPDLGHVMFRSPLALTPGAPAAGPDAPVTGVYEWGEGRLQLVSVDPNGTPTIGLLGGQSSPGEGPGGSVARAMSNDGRLVAWTSGDPYAARSSGTREYGALYVRDTVEGKTVRVGGPRALLQTMSSDGSQIFYLEDGDLYQFNYGTGAQTDLTSGHGAGEPSAGVKELVVGASEDGSHVYFVATGVLASGAVGGQDNLYLAHEEGTGWAVTYIATLSREDEPDWSAKGFYSSPALPDVTSRVSPDGRYVTFMSNRSLTGYDNTDAYSGQPDEEVYLYDATAGSLVCASCNPTGARPVGVLDTSQFGAPNYLLVDRVAAWNQNASRSAGDVRYNHWLAGSIPAWDYMGGSNVTTYQPRFLSDSGRLFFNSPDALVPQDTNGLEDVYEYEPVGVGDCTAASGTFSARSDGCVNLLTSGTSGVESVFLDASENGNDAFFVTASKLTAADYDTSYDVYDAHVCSAAVPCAATPVSPPPCTSGDSCKAAPAPQPEIFGPAPSATFSGTGNVVEEAKKSVVKHKVKTKRRRSKRKRSKARRSRISTAASRKGKR
jgi:hypothetical protein